MKSFWWFKKDSIAGMGRPGFNNVHWTDLPFREGMLLGWIGRYSCGGHNLDAFRKHLEYYVPRTMKFYDLNEHTAAQQLEIFKDENGVKEIAQSLAKRTQILASVDVGDNHLHIKLCQKRLNHEIEFLKKQGIKKIVTLTETHNQKDELEEHFDLHHFAIDDMHAPSVEQVHQLSEVIRQATKSNEAVAVHCLAGIGRTSTMIMAAHMVLGETAEDLELLIKEKNPVFTMTGPQGEFLRTFKK